MKQTVIIRDLGQMEYHDAWALQEDLLRRNIEAKMRARESEAFRSGGQNTFGPGDPAGQWQDPVVTDTRHYLLFVEHAPVYTLGKSGREEHLLIGEQEMAKKGIGFYRTNRGGDITFHGAGQVVGYPILDLEKFDTDIGWYLRSLEEVIIRTLGSFGIEAGRSPGETGVWLDPGLPGRARKICAMGVRCSRWITMHGFALNVNTDLSYFDGIIPCGIQNKQVGSMEKELGHPVNMQSVKDAIRYNFGLVFGADCRDIENGED